MKLRIRGDSLRLRLTQTEVTKLVEAGRIEESTAFAGGGRFSYAVVFGGSTVSAKLGSGGVEVVIPPDVARAWAASDAVGIEAAEPAGDGRTLRIAIEKDFACLKPREDEDDSDAFPHPKAGTTTEC